MATGELQEDPDILKEVRMFLKAALESYPDLESHCLAAAHRRGRSEEGREAPTRTMRELL